MASLAALIFTVTASPLPNAIADADADPEAEAQLPLGPPPIGPAPIIEVPMSCLVMGQSETKNSDCRSLIEFLVEKVFN